MTRTSDGTRWWPGLQRQGKEPVERRHRTADRDEGVTVDYRLLPRFEASYRRHEDARNGLPERWRSDPRPEVQLVNEIYVGLVARARANIEEISTPDPGDVGNRRVGPPGFEPGTKGL